ncbi:MAG: PAS domain S-box protein [Chloroflexia bacterium]|nr:PAS domain S-box protein [Chloroflexia bacterium]
MSGDNERALARLSAIVQWSADAIVSTDVHHIVTSWNPAAERLLGYSAVEAIGRSCELSVPPEHIEKRRLRLGNLAPGEAIVGIETTRLRKDGSLVDVEITVSTLQDADGALIGFSSILRDSSERKAAEARLRQLERRYRTFVEQMPALTYITAPGSEWNNIPLLHLSTRVEEVTGYSAQHWVENPRFIFTIMHPDDHDRVVAIDRESSLTGEPYRAEYRVFAADGRMMWFRDEAVLVRDETDGSPLYWIGFLLDITDQKRAEEEVHAALAGQRAANHQLARASNEKSEFLAVISHEFRSPLTSIQGFSELIVDESLTAEEARGFAATINTNARRLARMISDLLDLDRLESGQITVQRIPVSLRQVVDDVIASFGPTASHHQFVTRFDPAPPPLVGDPDLLIQVVTNLIANAIKYSPAGGQIIVSTSHQAGTVRLSVRDHGLGIPEVALETIFSRYARLPRPEQKDIVGTGLGLPIARQIVGLHHGTIWAEAPAGGGSMFIVELPAGDGQGGEPPVDAG